MVSFQPNMQAHDDLAALFSRNLTFNPELQSQASASKLMEEERNQIPNDPAPVNNTTIPDVTSHPIVYSATQHYTHSAHLVHQPSNNLQDQQPQQQQQQPQGQDPQRRLSEPPQTEQLTPEVLLARNGVDLSVLSPSQLQLFRISDTPQQERLVEIWRAAPPTNNHDNPALAWTSTTLEQEELWAKLRYERQEQQKQQQQKMDLERQPMRLDAAQVQGPDSRWLSSYMSQSCEPYMMSGYEELIRSENEHNEASKNGYSHVGSAVDGNGSRYSHATDPVYKGSGVGVDRWSQQQPQMQMENQYGAFQQNHQFGGPVGNAEAMEIM